MPHVPLRVRLGTIARILNDCRVAILVWDGRELDISALWTPTVFELLC